MKYLFLNTSLLRELNLTPDQIVGFSMEEKFPGIEKTDVYTKIVQCLETDEEQKLVNEFVYEGGKRAFYDVLIQRVPEGVMIFTSDISESKKGEKLLQESNELLEEKVRGKTLELEEKNRQLEVSKNFYRNILETLPFGMHLFSLNEKSELIFEDANRAADNILGIDHKLLFGKTIQQAFPNIELTGIPAKFKSIAEHGGTFHDINIDYEDDRYRGTYENFNFQVGDNQVISFFRDITKQRQMEHSLRQQQKMEAIGVMTGGVAHEFNNLLLPVMGFSEILYAEATDEDTRDKLQKIITASERASKLIRSMLAFSRQSQEPQKPISLTEVVEGTLAFIANTLAKNIVVSTRLPSQIPLINGVSNDIQQILLNLILNASHAMPGGGEIDIQLTKVTDCEGLKGEYIELKVSDSGEGIPEAVIDKIFDPFFTTKETGRGTGLGLSVVQGVVEQHEGAIRVDSREGHGTTFTLYFPAIADIALDSGTPDVHDASRGLGRVMVVDDEEDIVDLIQQNLTLSGYQVEGFTLPHKALSAYSAAPDYYDLVILDYGMPDMSGKDLATSMRQHRPDIKIILMTGYGKLVSEENIRAWGVDKSIVKPFRFAQLSELVTTALDGT